MKNVTPLRIASVLVATLAAPTLAHAHPAHALVYDCASGLAHPLLGWDHLLAMIAVGFLAAHYGGRARWVLPTAFLTVMTGAAIFGAHGFALPGAETMIASSVLVFGVLITVAARLPLVAATAIVAVFAFAHGMAHGAEIPANAAAFSYGFGFVVSTALLHGFGLLLAQLASLKSAHVVRIAGLAWATAGVALLIA